MTFEKANKIVQIWGKYLEYASGKLMSAFGARIPESFLPFPKKTLEEALNIIAEYHHNNGNQDKVKLIQETAVLLTTYIDDEEAFLQAAKSFNDPSWRKAMFPAFKEFQNDWIKTQGDF